MTVVSRQEIDADFADIMGPPDSPLDLPLEHTMFLDLAAKTAPRHVSSIRQIAAAVKKHSGSREGGAAAHSSSPPLAPFRRQRGACATTQTCWK